MIIKLKRQQGEWATGSLHLVKAIVPHGGHFDDALQYVLNDETHVPESAAEVLVLDPQPPIRETKP